ncbi:Bidirectional sugar transporter sweet [Thalictrum thalictroides]|uniref:Bidirectional sugar transporter sweet n=1 Tax=Thalictrum thalictroides TaxID=46969 RepID=A0A7J6VST3_THATH|nr:Bidirectional sugar transporter sweet [Thalictrum thalictroides]
MAPVIMFCIAMITSSIAMEDQNLRGVMVGSFGFVASIALYGSPLVAMKLVIQTSSVEYMPFFLSFFSFLTSSLWMAYGLLSLDFLLASPNLLGVPLGVLQLVLYCLYCKENPDKEPYKVDLENGENTNLITPLISDTPDDVKNEKV